MFFLLSFKLHNTVKAIMATFQLSLEDEDSRGAPLCMISVEPSMFNRLAESKLPHMTLWSMTILNKVIKAFDIFIITFT